MAALVVACGLSVTEAKNLTLRELQALENVLKARGG